MHNVDVRAGALVAPARGYWTAAPILAIAMFAVVAVRLHEFVPLVRLLKPVFLVSIAGTFYLLSRSSDEVRRAALKHPLMRLVIAYFVWIGVTIPTALWQGLAFSTLRGFLPAVLTFLTVLLCAPERRILDRLQSSFVILVLIYAAYAQAFGNSWNGRLSIGGMYDSNDMASLMAIGFPLAAGMLTRASPGRDRAAAILAVVALGLGVIATGSRGGTLALLAGIIVFGLGFRGGRGAMVILALLVACGIGWVTAPPTFRSRMISLNDLEGDYNYTHQSGRKAVWERGRGYIKDNLVFGVGAGNFPIAEGPGLASLGMTGKWSAAHNAYVQSYAELGLTGGTLFVCILLLGARYAKRFWRVPLSRSRDGPLDRPELLGALAAFACGGYFLSHAYYPPAIALLALIAFAERVQAARIAVPAIHVFAPQSVRAVGERGGLAARISIQGRMHGMVR
jgi:O-antigen ligase